MNIQNRDAGGACTLYTGAARKHNGGHSRDRNSRFCDFGMGWLSMVGIRTTDVTATVEHL